KFWSDTMYDMICTQNDVLRERFIAGSNLVGKFGFPKLEPINADVTGLTPVPFHMANKEKNPRQAVLHCFTEDYRFEGLWKEPLKSIDTLLNFKYVCPCDFSVYSNMPLVLQIYNVYRDRAIHHFLTCCGVKCIPVVVWSDERSFDWCFDGLPQNSTLAVSTNGCHTIRAREYYKHGFAEMCKWLNPNRVIVVGGKIDVNCDVEIQYLDGFSQQMKKRMESA
ncbi:MAG: DUF4417 domain-containing protein, partial [Lachnospiraceae bacterium]|nr:DUF4417 domain-containing protein [Lachnospiraceae bacterium]